jgi:hypothetical protein
LVVYLIDRIHRHVPQARAPQSLPPVDEVF